MNEREVKEVLQVAGNCSCSGFGTTEKDHHFPTSLSLNLLNRHLYCDCKGINAAVRYKSVAIPMKKTLATYRWT